MSRPISRAEAVELAHRNLQRAEDARAAARAADPDSTLSPSRSPAERGEARTDEEVETAIASLRAAVVDDNTLGEWFRPGYLLEVARLLSRLRADARLGAAVREARARNANPLHIMADGRVWLGTASQITTEATRRLAALLAAAPTDPDPRR